MKRGLVGILSVGSVVAILGCDALVGLLLPSRVTVTLVNTSPTFDIEATVVYHDEEDTLKEIVILLGTDQDFIIGPGERVSFSRDCDDLGSLVLEDADLRVLGGIGPEVDSDLLRIGDDFECGDEIVFTFTHAAIPIDLILDIDVRVSSNGLLSRRLQPAR